MAEKTIRVCDRCSADDEDTSAVKTREVQLDGPKLEIDLCAKHNSELDRLLEALESWKGWARPAQRSRPKRSRAKTPATEPQQPTVQPETPPAPPTLVDDERAATVRAWARENGFEVAERGRLSPEILAAYASRNRASA